MSAAAKNCSRCGELLPLDSFYFVSRATGKRRGMCKPCMAEVKAAQRDPAWLPTCARCGNERPRVGPGRRLCAECFTATYDAENVRANGSHRLRLKPCPVCGATRLRADHVTGTMLCPVCRSLTQGRRKRLVKVFNLTPAEYLAMIEAQGVVCAVCRVRPASHVDHRHAEPRILRGVLCNTCNTLLGLARDNPTLLRAAAAFLDDPIAQRLYPGRTAAHEANRFNPVRRSRKAAVGAVRAA